MKLTAFRVQEFKSTHDPNLIAVGDVTCLVGKNESGKTSLLQALYKLNPVIAEHSKYDVVDEYPRADVEDYQQAIEAGQRKPATVVTATFELEAVEVLSIEKEFGKGVIPDKNLTVSKKYDDGLIISLSVDDNIAGTANACAGRNGKRVERCNLESASRASSCLGGRGESKNPGAQHSKRKVGRHYRP